jgi:hypothetical protein
MTLPQLACPHHDAIAQRGHLLHDVAGEDHAAALGAQLPAGSRAWPRGHHVEAVGGLVQDHVARVVHQGARDRGLGALALREAFALPVQHVLHVERLDQRLAGARRSRPRQAVQAPK